MQYDYGHLVGYHGMLYIISNLPKVATWRSKGFRIGPHIAEKSTTLLFTGTLGHTVAEAAQNTARDAAVMSCGREFVSMHPTFVPFRHDS